MHINTSFHRLAGFGLLLLLGGGSCTTQEVVAPTTTTCNERVTVRICLDCKPPFRTTLLLAKGYYVLPIGPQWEAYQAQPVDGQVIHVGYQLGRPLGPNEFGLQTATITCLEGAEGSTK